VIHVDGVEYGSAAEIAARLGPGVTPTMVRNWHRRDGLKAHRIGRAVYFELGQAAAIERDKRASTRGRPRMS
jgi:hypothetical protein